MFPSPLVGEAVLVSPPAPASCPRGLREREPGHCWQASLTLVLGEACPSLRGEGPRGEPPLPLSDDQLQ